MTSKYTGSLTVNAHIQTLRSSLNVSEEKDCNAFIICSVTAMYRTCTKLTLCAVELLLECVKRYNYLR